VPARRRSPIAPSKTDSMLGMNRRWHFTRCPAQIPWRWTIIVGGVLPIC